MYSGEENEEQNILRGEQNITDGEQEEAEPHAARQMMQEEQDDDDANEDMDDGEDLGEDDEDQLIDIAGLEDHEKAILLQYLHDEYQKNPDQLPMPKEVVAQLLAENKDMVEGLQLMPGQQLDDEEQEEEQDEDQDEGDYGADDNQDQMIQVHNNNAMVIEGEQNESEERDVADDEDEEDDEEKEEYVEDDQGEP